MRRYLALAALALTLAGCGGDQPEQTPNVATGPAKTNTTAEDSATTGAGSDQDRATKAEYEAGFRRANARAEQVAAEGGDNGDLGPARRSVRALVSGLRAVAPPADIAEAHRDYVAGLQALLAVYRRAEAALRRGDKKEAERIAARFDIPQDVAARARQARIEFERRGYDLPLAALR